MLSCCTVYSPDNTARCFIEGVVPSGCRFTVIAIWNYVQCYGISIRITEIKTEICDVKKSDILEVFERRSPKDIASYSLFVT
jgi:hypothetical protein